MMASLHPLPCLWVNAVTPNAGLAFHTAIRAHGLTLWLKCLLVGFEGLKVTAQRLGSFRTTPNTAFILCHTHPFCQFNNFAS